MNTAEYIKTFVIDFVTILGEMAPFLLLGFLFAGLLYSFMPRQKIEKYFQGKPLKTSFLATMFGIPLPLCSCGVIPTGTALYKNGASKGGTVSFLISTPQTGIDSILATFSLLGLPFAIIRPIAALITGITGGVITSYACPEERNHTSECKEQMPSEERSFTQKVKDVFRYGFVEFIQDISKWLIIGLLIAAFISVLVPNQLFDLLNVPPFVQMLLILLLSIPLYVCATGSIPLATVLLLKGLSPGAVFVFLMAGPATNAAAMTLIGNVLGKRSMFIYVLTIMVGALSFGLLIDYALPVEWFLQITESSSIGHENNSGLGIVQIVSGIVLSALMVNGYIQKHVGSSKKIDSSVETVSFRVEGMSCNHCKSNVEKNLIEQEGVDNVSVVLGKKTVTVEGKNLNSSQLKDTIAKLGFKPE